MFLPLRIRVTYSPGAARIKYSTLVRTAGKTGEDSARSISSSRERSVETSELRNTLENSALIISSPEHCASPLGSALLKPSLQVVVRHAVLWGGPPEACPAARDRAAAIRCAAHAPDDDELPAERTPAENATPPALSSVRLVTPLRQTLEKKVRETPLNAVPDSGAHYSKLSQFFPEISHAHTPNA